MAKINITDLGGGLNLQEPSTLKDNQFEALTNMFYNADGRLQSRRGTKVFGAALPGGQAQTSGFFYKNPKTLKRTLLTTSGTSLYEYNETTDSWDEVATDLLDTEADGVTKTRWSFAVYLETIYMCDGVNPYSKYFPETQAFSRIGLSASGNPTADFTTNTFTLTAHTLVESDVVKITSTTSIPGGLEVGRYYYVVNVATNTFQLSLYPKGEVANFTGNGIGTLTVTKLTQPRPRIVGFLADSIHGAGDDVNPSTLYASNSGAVDANDLTANEIFVGGEIDGRINWLEELQAQVLAGKDKKIYNIAGDFSSAVPIDAENGGYGDKAVKRVGNGLIYFNDRGFNTLKAKNGAVGTTALQDEPLSDDVRALTSQVLPRRYNSTIGEYIPELTNYYGSFDTTNSGANNTTLVYSALKGAWSRYIYPAHYDFANYEDENGEIHHLIFSAASDQVIEIEVGFDDLGAAIPCVAITKRYDLGEATEWKTHEAVDIQGLKSEGGEITVEVFVSGESVGTAVITDDQTKIGASGVLTVGTKAIGESVIGGGEVSGEEVALYRYYVKMPMYEAGEDIQIKMTSEEIGLVWTLDKITLHLEKESVDLYEYTHLI